MNRRHQSILMLGMAVGASTTALAQTAPPAGTANEAGIGDIVVTAQKREQALNDVGLTVAAATGDTLLQRGVSDINDLAKIVPGFTASASGFTTPVYTLRGVGLYDYSFGSSPSVAVYVDEIARPFPVTQMGVTLDLERVEVMKGPQGTLFGQSSTGGAINYIAAKPTDRFEAGLDLSYERFGKIDAQGFVSGPLSDTLKGRLAVRAVEGGAWQYSVSRPDDKNGETRQLQGRLLLDWKPTEKLSFSLNVNGMRDKSDNQRAQFLYNQMNIVGAPGSGNPYEQADPVAFATLTNPASPGYDPSHLGRQATVFGRLSGMGFAPGAVLTPNDPANQAALLGGPMGNGGPVPDNARLAEWTPGWPSGSNDSFYQFALRTDYELTDAITVTSLTSWQKTKISHFFDNDATTAVALDGHLFGFAKSFSQELRLSGQSGGLNWIIGGNYDWSKIRDVILFKMFEISNNEPLPGLRWNDNQANIDQTIKNYAAFANADLEVTPNLTVQGGIRYTRSKRTAAACSNTPYDDIAASKIFGNADSVPGFGFYDLQTAFGLDPAGHVVVERGQCYPLNDVVAPTDPQFLRPTITPWVQSLDEDNISFRVGANYKTDGGTLLYATLSQGYKSGIISGIYPAVVSQYVPATQEKLIAYEAGIKAPLMGRRVQLNAAGFYYDYRDKQVRARVRDSIFGLLETLVNVPKSYIWGLEAEILARPVEGLTLSMSGTYLKSKVTSSFSDINGRALYNQTGYTGDFKDSPLPFTPKFSGVFDGQYEAPLTGNINGFIGTTVTHAGRDNATFYNDVLKADQYFRREHTLLDLRAGLADPDGAWRLTFYGRNVTNKFYETTFFTGIEPTFRYVGKPRIFGAQLSLRTR